MVKKIIFCALVTLLIGGIGKLVLGINPQLDILFCSSLLGYILGDLQELKKRIK